MVGRADWHPDELRGLAAAVLLDALQRGERAFLTAPREPWRSHRRLWLGLLGLDVEAAEAALRRFCALPWEDRQARLAGLEAGPRRRRRWDRERAFAGTLEGLGRRRED